MRTFIEPHYTCAKGRMLRAEGVKDTTPCKAAQSLQAFRYWTPLTRDVQTLFAPASIWRTMMTAVC